MKRISREQAIFTFSKEHKAAAKAVSGETVIFETSDCYNNMLTNEEQLKTDELGSFQNPATGPLYIEGAEVGDILKIEIIDIKLAKEGRMTLDTRDPILGEKFEENKLKIIPIESGFAKFNEQIKVPLNPMVGVIGVAPEGQEIATVMPGSHGGNMDCKEIKKGSILYLPVNTEGGLLALGDLHGVMGDGEAGGCGLEIPGEVTLKVQVVKDKTLPLPMVVSEGKLITIGTAETMEEANKLAVFNMHKFLVEELKINIYDAAYLLSLVADLKICQVVNALMTARMELALDILEKHNYKMP